MCELFDDKTPAGVHEAYLEKLKTLMQLGGGQTHEHRLRLVRVLRDLPEGPQLLEVLRAERPYRYEELMENLRQAEHEERRDQNVFSRQ